MRTGVKRLMAVAVGPSLFASCSVSLAGARTSQAVAPPSGVTRPASEVLLWLRGEPPVLAKLVGIDGEQVAFLPSPYWNVATRHVALGEILTVEEKDRKRTLGRATGVSFAAGFVIIGVACGASAKYNNDYQGCLAVSAVLGAAAGLVGLAVGAIVDASHPGTYHFDRMDPAEKRKTVERFLAR
ncbi:MAG: hypothetical protein ACM3PV_02320 [Betaproteobacteria bacterium]